MQSAPVGAAEPAAVSAAGAAAAGLGAGAEAGAGALSLRAWVRCDMDQCGGGALPGALSLP